MISISRFFIYATLAIIGIIGIWVALQFYNLFAHAGESAVYFLNVGQGDSELVVLYDTENRPVHILIDGGRDSRVLRELDRVIPEHDPYIDAVILTHGDSDHFKGLFDVLQEYRVGVFLWTGREGTSSSFVDLLSLIKSRHIRIANLSAGDRLRFSNFTFDVLSPRSQDVHTVSINESSLVLILRSFDGTVLFTGDIGHATEKVLAQKNDIDIDVLKVAHHGSKNSSFAQFLEATSPMLSVIEVGNNSYGHPHQSVIARLESVGSMILRTDIQGTIKLVLRSL